MTPSDDLRSEWQTSLRRCWMGDYLWELKKDRIIEHWAWAPGESEFFEPMTKPPLNEGQQTCMLAEYLMYFELIQSEPRKAFKQICADAVLAGVLAA